MDFSAASLQQGAVVNDGETPVFPSKNSLKETAFSQSAMHQAMRQAMQMGRMGMGMDETWRTWENSTAMGVPPQNRWMLYFREKNLFL